MAAFLARRCWSVDELLPGEALELLRSAQAFERFRAGSRPLRGTHVAVLCDAPSSPSADAFTAAAASLGAAVVRLRPTVSRLRKGDDSVAVARMLGRLYGAIECDGVEPEFMEELHRVSGVPVFSPVAGDTHPARLLGDLKTMCEHSGKPPGETTLCLCAAPGSPLTCAWQRLAEMTGVCLCSKLPCLDHAAHESDFVCDPWHRSQEGSPPKLLALDRATGRTVPLLGRQIENHRFVVQAMLSTSVH